ncbi:MAG: hypothetical protein PHS96_03960 [Anaerolineales bacterium]|nr:hypothetical protein [Anaerolineales bacterium]
MSLLSPGKITSPRSLAVYLLWTALFSLAYTQSPLYTSNQNTYFLHGLARAGSGYLGQDWLANTADATPLFSALVFITLRLLRWPGWFYVYYALILGVYFFSLLGAITQAVDLRRSRALWLAYASAVFCVHSAGWRFALTHLVSPNWTYILEDGFADQRMLGVVFQPSVFAVLLLLAVALHLRQRHHLAGLAAALAASLHPAYLLSAGCLEFAFLVDLSRQKKPAHLLLTVGLLALLAVAPVVVYTWATFSSQTPEVAARAREIIATVRIPHHALVAQWWDATAMLKLALILAAVVLARRTPLFYLLLVPLLLGGALTLLQVLTGSYALALLFPWRISILLLPLSVGLLLAHLLEWLLARPLFHAPRSQRLVIALSLVLIALTVLVGSVRLWLDFARQATQPERALEAYVRGHASPGELYLIPLKLQDFRLSAGVPVFVDFRSTPYKDVEVLEWYRRYQLADRFYRSPDCAQLAALARDEGLTHVVLPSSADLTCPFLHIAYRSPHWIAVAMLPQ